jgi:hypothetical protein
VNSAAAAEPATNNLQQSDVLDQVGTKEDATSKQRSMQVCVFQQRVDNPHISSTSGTIAVQSHGWWTTSTPACKTETARVKVGLLRLIGGKWVDAGSQGNIITLPGGGKGQRATAHYNCPVGKTYKYRAWVDVDLIHYVDPSVLTWSKEISVTCKR